jgi:hypothetical protein
MLPCNFEILKYDTRNTQLILGKYDVLGFGNDVENELNQMVISNSLFVSDDDGSVHEIDIGTFRLLKSEQRHTNICTSICMGRDGIISGGMDYICKISKEISIDFSVQETKQMFNPPAIYCLAISKNATKLACGLGTGKIAIIHPSKGEIVETLDQHTYIVNIVYVTITHFQVNLQNGTQTTL